MLFLSVLQAIWDGVVGIWLSMPVFRWRRGWTTIGMIARVGGEYKRCISGGESGLGTYLYVAYLRIFEKCHLYHLPESRRFIWSQNATVASDDAAGEITL